MSAASIGVSWTLLDDLPFVRVFGTRWAGRVTPLSLRSSLFPRAPYFNHLFVFFVRLVLAPPARPCAVCCIFCRLLLPYHALVAYFPHMLSHFLAIALGRIKIRTSCFLSTLTGSEYLTGTELEGL